MLVGNPNYIEIYDNALNKKECDMLINHFEKSKLYPASTGGLGYRPDLKKCVQLDSPCFSDNSRISNITLPIVVRCLNRYKEKYNNLLSNNIMPWKYADNYSFQKYEAEDDGYKVWHTEQSGGEEASYRILVWMIYLNDAKSGTEFMKYPTIRAKMGRCVIWPAGWTHVHRGVTPNKGLKYIITGWASFNRVD
jgi:hypothetical protein